MTDDLLFKITESKTQGAIRWMQRALEAEAKVESHLTPRRIDEDTPDGVLVWSGESWLEAWRSINGDWVDLARFRCQPKWWLPMLPAPEDKS